MKRNYLIICPADKGNATVILNKSRYNDEMKLLLNNPTYQIETLITNKDIEKEIQEKCMNLKKTKRITEEKYKFLTPSDTRTPRFYALPKIHKQDMPFRPIVDFRYSASYNLAKFLGNILKILGSNHSTTLVNSYHFAQDISTISVPSGYTMISYDVVSLFTNVPIEFTKGIIQHKLETTVLWKSQAGSLLSQEVMELLDICINSSIFTWEHITYRQISGLPMGSPISPPFAELFMQSLEETIIIQNEAIHFWRRLVDDTFTIIPDGEEEELLDKLNSFNEAINFTYEKEENGQLPFLDTLVIKKEDGTLGKTIFRKKTYTGRYLNFSSYHHRSHKISVIDALSFRAYVNCDPEYLEEELREITRSLRCNGFPLKLINERFHRMKQRAANWNPSRRLSNSQNQKDKKPRLILPYMGPITTRLTKFLRMKLDCEFGYIPGKKLGSFLCKLKDQLKPNQIGGIYKIPIKVVGTNTFVKWYVGETSKPLQTRLNQHRRDVDKHKETSALVKHLNEHPYHYVDFDSASLIEKEPRHFHRKCKEHLYIITNDTVNINRGQITSSIWDASLPQFMKPLDNP